MQKYSIGIFEKIWMICFSQGKYLIRNKKKAKVKKKVSEKVQEKTSFVELRMNMEIVNTHNLWGIENGLIVFSLFKVAQIDAQESKWQICWIEWRRWWWCWQKRWGYYDITLPNKNSESTQNSWFKNTATKVYSFYADFLVCCHFAIFGVMFSFPLWNSVKVMHHDLTRLGKTTIKRVFPLLREQS